MVSLHCNLDEKTKHLINAERLSMMKPDAVLVNAARGPVIDEAALVSHLQANPEFRRAARVPPCTVAGIRDRRSRGVIVDHSVALHRMCCWPVHDCLLHSWRLVGELLSVGMVCALRSAVVAA